MSDPRGGNITLLAIAIVMLFIISFEKMHYYCYAGGSK